MGVSTHSGRLERWLGGAERLEQISASMKDWYGPPIALAGVPGAVYAAKGGDFVGRIKGGGFANIMDFTEQRAKRVLRNWERRQRSTMNAGFASLSDLISEATTGGKARVFPYAKLGVTGLTGVTMSLWLIGSQPPAGAAAAGAPGGAAPTDATTGAFPFANPTVGDTQHFVRWDGAAAIGANTLLLYDRIFHVTKTMNSTATEAVTGVPTRYQNTDLTAADSIAGNFLAVQVGLTILPATAHNWTVCLYLDQANASSTLPSITGNATAIAHRLDMPALQWFAPLESGDVGVKALTQMQCSALVATGTIEFFIGHPIAFMPHPVANQLGVLDGINSAFNLQRIFDDACLAFLEITKPSTTATTYTGMFTTVAG